MTCGRATADPRARVPDEDEGAEPGLTPRSPAPSGCSRTSARASGRWRSRLLAVTRWWRVLGGAGCLGAGSTGDRGGHGVRVCCVYAACAPCVACVLRVHMCHVCCVCIVCLLPVRCVCTVSCVACVLCVRAVCHMCAACAPLVHRVCAACSVFSLPRPLTTCPSLGAPLQEQHTVKSRSLVCPSSSRPWGSHAVLGPFPWPCVLAAVLSLAVTGAPSACPPGRTGPEGSWPLAPTMTPH